MDLAVDLVGQAGAVVDPVVSDRQELRAIRAVVVMSIACREGVQRLFLAMTTHPGAVGMRRGFSMMMFRILTISARWPVFKVVAIVR